MSSALPDLDLNLLRYLVVLVQEGGVSRAAERLALTQPAMSAALKRLRERFGDPILVRSGQMMSPTPRALEMADQLAPLLAGVKAMIDGRERFEPRQSRRQFALMGSDYVQFLVLPRLCAWLERQQAQIAIVHRPANPSKIEPWMESGQVDLGIGYLETPPPALRSRLLFSDRQVCLLRKGHPAGRSPLGLEGYAALSHVAVSPGGTGIYGRRIDALLRTHGVRRRTALTLPSFLAMPYVVSRTDYVATVPGRFARYFATLLPLAIAEPPLPLPAFEISMFWHERVHHDAAHVWLRRQVVEATQELGAD
jgi:DNA-binding transcriptional LysR family regulator